MEKVFGIRKVKLADKGYEFVGVFLPRQTNSFLLLYALAKGASKSTVVRNLVESWVTDTETYEGDYLRWISELTAKAQREWESRKTRSQYTELKVSQIFIEYKRELQQELKGLQEDHKATILQGLKI